MLVVLRIIRSNLIINRLILTYFGKLLCRHDREQVCNYFDGLL
jgi:hypothetical protein